jgi:hypothetical protein
VRRFTLLLKQRGYLCAEITAKVTPYFLINLTKLVQALESKVKPSELPAAMIAIKKTTRLSRVLVLRFLLVINYKGEVVVLPIPRLFRNDFFDYENKIPRQSQRLLQHASQMK